MTLEEIKQLHTGDQVYWTDPDDGIASRYYTIQHLEINGEIITITAKDGAVLECFAHELS